MRNCREFDQADPWRRLDSLALFYWILWDSSPLELLAVRQWTTCLIHSWTSFSSSTIPRYSYWSWTTALPERSCFQLAFWRSWISYSYDHFSPGCSSIFLPYSWCCIKLHTGVATLMSWTHLYFNYMFRSKREINDRIVLSLAQVKISSQI